MELVRLRKWKEKQTKFEIEEKREKKEEMKKEKKVVRFEEERKENEKEEQFLELKKKFLVLEEELIHSNGKSKKLETMLENVFSRFSSLSSQLSSLLSHFPATSLSNSGEQQKQENQQSPVFDFNFFSTLFSHLSSDEIQNLSIGRQLKTGNESVERKEGSVAALQRSSSELKKKTKGNEGKEEEVRKIKGERTKVKKENGVREEKVVKKGNVLKTQISNGQCTNCKRGKQHERNIHDLLLPTILVGSIVLISFFSFIRRKNV